MKKLINDPADVVSDALKGLAVAHPETLVVHRDPDFVRRADSPVEGKVALVSGGGSGHEPLHTGFVGRGMLDAAVPGAIFASPSANQIHSAAQAVATDDGVLFVVKNYTGDRLNFQMAADLLAEDGIPSAIVLVDDDVAVEDSTHTAGRRGTGATILVEKMAGAAAEAGRSLAEVTAIAEEVNRCSRSIGIALSSSTVPHIGTPNFDLGEGEVEFGVGIHGEPGRERMPLVSADELVGMMFDAIATDLGLQSGDRVGAIVAGLGGTPLIEQYVAAGALSSHCERNGISIERCLVGPYITALEMAGCIITLLRLDDGHLELWDASVVTPTLTW